MPQYKDILDVLKILLLLNLDSLVVIKSGKGGIDCLVL